MAFPRLDATREVVRLVVVLLSRGYRAFLLTLVVVATGPVLIGWGSFVVTSGSMEPSISVGDVVVGRPVDPADEIDVGRVYVFRDQSRDDERLTVHRIVAEPAPGEYTTAGDANGVPDAIPLFADGIEARGILLVPLVGLPVVWLRSGEWLNLAMWLVLTIGAFWIATRNIEGEPPKWNFLRAVRELWSGGRPADAESSGKGDSRARPLAAVGTGIVLVVLNSVLVATPAGFTATARNSGNVWSVGQWTHGYVSAVLADDPTGFWLLDESSGAWAHNEVDRAGRYGPGVTLGHPGAPPTILGTSVYPGTGTITLTPDPVLSPPQAMSQEIWFRTTSTTGGILFGFRPSDGAPADRLLKVRPDGRLIYGDWQSQPYRTTVTPAAYNDGQWHHVVVSAARLGNRQEVTIYVDGSPVVTGQASPAGWMSGSWFIGPFDGYVDNPALFDSTLTTAQIQRHYEQR